MLSINLVFARKNEYYFKNIIPVKSKFYRMCWSIQQFENLFRFEDQRKRAQMFNYESHSKYINPTYIFKLICTLKL